MLRFKKKFYDAIRSGQKTQTIRLWKFRRFKPGQKSLIPGIGPIGIDAVDEVFLDDLTDADAVPDGFSDVASLRAELESIYGTPLSGKLFRVQFHLLTEDANLPEPAAEPVAVSRPEPLRLHTVSRVVRRLTEEETADRLANRCKIYRNFCDWNHEPGKSQDFFALFLKSPRDDRGVPSLSGMRLQRLVRERVSEEQWGEIGPLVNEVCRAWTEWQYALEQVVLSGVVSML
ncbi:MAG: ASCH domain-containing protein [Planctomycetia bacterium]|nr:ASCH domain-containing protein [Planctomycetia bacterium]